MDVLAWPLLCGYHRVEYEFFYFQLIEEVSVYFTVKLWSIINYDRLRYSEPSDNILPHKMGEVLVFDGSKGFDFYPFSKVDGGNKQ